MAAKDDLPDPLVPPNRTIMGLVVALGGKHSRRRSLRYLEVSYFFFSRAPMMRERSVVLEME